MTDFVEGFLENYPEEIRTISLKLRDLARHEMKNASEFLYYNAITYSLSSSPLDRVCYIRPLQYRVTLGLLFGKQLEDPNHILHGIGKRSRYVVVRTVDEAKNSALKDLLKAAWTKAPDSVVTMRVALRQHRADLRHRVHRHHKRAGHRFTLRYSPKHHT